MSTNQWLQSALKHLQQAESIGEKTNALLKYTRKSLQRKDYYDTRGCFLLDALKEQNELYGAIVDSVKLQADGKKKLLRELERTLASSMAQLEHAYNSLRNVRLPKSLHDGTLFDFIDDKMLDTLERQTGSLHTGHDLLDAMYREHDTLKQTLNYVSVLNDYDFDNSNQLIATINEVQEIEMEIATILESLTSHYDQCVKGADVERGELEMSSAEKEELFAVLEKDNNDLPEIIVEIEDCFQELKLKCDSIQVTTKIYDELVEKAKTMFDVGSKSLRRSIGTLEITTVQFNKLVEAVSRACDESKELCEHYANFRKSYAEFLKEVTRRHQAQEAMLTVVHEAQASLEALQQEDTKQRDVFLQKHGDSLPSNLWSKIPQGDLVSLHVSKIDIPEV